MMRLRDWPPRRIGVLWLAGCAVEALLIAALAFTGEPAAPYPRRLADSVFAADTGSAIDAEEMLRNVGISVTREPQASGDTLVRITRDSSFAAARVGQDTITVVAASPDVERAIHSIGTAFVAAADGLARLLLLLAAILLPIPILLIAVTLTWAVQRRLHRT